MATSQSSSRQRMIVERHLLLLLAFLWAIRGILNHSAGALSRVGYVVLAGACATFAIVPIIRGIRERCGD